MTKIFTCLLILVLINNVTFGQSLKEKTADKFYNELSFSKAAVFYKELASENKATPKNIRRAAECYRNLNDFKNSEFFYDRLATTNDFSSEDAYNFSQVLKTLGNYKKANDYLDRVSASSPYSIVTKHHQENKDYNVFLKNDSINYVLKNIEINSEENDFSPFIYKNDFYFTSNRRNVSLVNKTFAWDGSFFLDQYKCNYENGALSNVKALSSTIDSKYHEGPGVISADGSTLYLTRSNYLDKKLGKDIKKQINLKVYVSKKDEKGAWGNFENFPFNSDEYSIGHPAISEDGQTIYFVSDMPGGFGQTDIYETHQENGAWSKPTNLGEAINSPGKEMFPTVFKDGTLFYSSDGHAGLGGLDLYFAVPEKDNFFTPQNLGYPINTQYDDFGMFLHEDIKTGFLSSNRIGGKGKDDIYTFTSTDFIIPQFVIDGFVTDKYTNEPISNANIDLYDESGKVVNTFKTDIKGAYKFNLLAGNVYSLEAIKDDYVKAKFSFNTKDPSNKKLKTDLKLEPSGMFALSGFITDANTKQLLNNVAVIIKDKKTGQEVLKSLTTNAGDFEKMLGSLKGGDLLEYEIQLQKEGYASKTITFTQTLGKPGVIKINELLDMSLTPVSNGEADVFAINPIFFDLNKSEIRPDAQTELDKLVEILKTRKDIKIEITSSTDCRATNAYNMNLSERRTNATANYLVSKGINKNRLKLKWTGENNLTTNCSCEPSKESSCSEEQHQQNRRSSFKATIYKADRDSNLNM